MAGSRTSTLIERVLVISICAIIGYQVGDLVPTVDPGGPRDRIGVTIVFMLGGIIFALAINAIWLPLRSKPKQ